jgi:polysaccharide export outer membrane protein
MRYSETMRIDYEQTTLWSDRFSAIGLILLLLSAVNSSLALAEGEYLLGDGDTVNITVYGHQDLTVVARISPEGTISYPLLEEVKIGGLTPQAAGRKIARMLKEGGFIKSPQVSLSVQDYSSQQIHIIGQIGNPGNYPLEGESNVVDMIARAGGVQDDAADVIFVIKKGADGKPVRHEIDLLRFYDGDMTQNIQVTRGDTILVPKMDTFFIHGEVKRSGEYRLERGMTVVQALSVGGGLNDRGSLKGMKVTRRLADGDTEKVKVELNDLLKPGDVLYVKERLF